MGKKKKIKKLKKKLKKQKRVSANATERAWSARNRISELEGKLFTANEAIKQLEEKIKYLTKPPVGKPAENKTKETKNARKNGKRTKKASPKKVPREQKKAG